MFTDNYLVTKYFFSLKLSIIIVCKINILFVKHLAMYNNSFYILWIYFCHATNIFTIDRRRDPPPSINPSIIITLIIIVVI